VIDREIWVIGGLPVANKGIDGIGYSKIFPKSPKFTGPNLSVHKGKKVLIEPFFSEGEQVFSPKFPESMKVE